jgi:fluoride exporter
MTKYLVIALGGALGAMTRYFIGNLISSYFTSGFPWGTFIINITGSFIIGFFLTLIGEQITLSPQWRLAVAVGFVGAYTTFSTFEYEILKLIEGNNIATAFLYISASLLVGFLAVWSGAITSRNLGTKAVGIYKAYKADSTVATKNLESKRSRSD